MELDALAQLEFPHVVGNRTPFNGEARLKLLVAVLMQHSVVDQTHDLVVVSRVVIVRVHCRDLGRHRDGDVFGMGGRTHNQPNRKCRSRQRSPH